MNKKQNRYFTGSVFCYINEATVSTNSTTLSAVFCMVFFADELFVFDALIIAAAEHTANVAPTAFIMLAVVFFFITFLLLHLSCNNIICTNANNKMKKICYLKILLPMYIISKLLFFVKNKSAV